MPVEQVEHDGVMYELQLSEKPSSKNGGYVGVVKQGNHFHAKITIFCGKGQTMIPGPGCNTAQEAALRLAVYKAAPYHISRRRTRSALREARARCVASIELCSSANVRLLPAQKRKATSDWDATWGPGVCAFPPWVVCMDSLTLYREGVPLPDDLKLSKKAVRQVYAIRECGRRERTRTARAPLRLSWQLQRRRKPPAWKRCGQPACHRPRRHLLPTRQLSQGRHSSCVDRVSSVRECGYLYLDFL